MIFLTKALGVHLKKKRKNLKVLLEILLRCCPGINSIYILLREKKGVKPEGRKESIFKKEIFQEIKENNPEVLKKVCVVAGDITQLNLGMSEEDALQVVKVVSVVFHCAATTNFLKPLRFIILHNAVATDNVLEFCRKLRKLDVIVYTSTAYSNSNRKCDLEETIYRLPFPAQMFLDASRDQNEAILDHLVSQCFPPWPNSYAFSKCLAENVIADNAADLPVAIIRPSIISSVWKGILPGYLEEGSGFVTLVFGVGKGSIRVIYGDKNKRFDHVPVDVVANTHVIAARSLATKRFTSPLIVNCTSGETEPCTFDHAFKAAIKSFLKYPLPKTYRTPSFIMIKSSVGYWVLSRLKHYTPAMTMDCLLWLSGRKPKFVSLYRTFDKVMHSLHYFVTNDWNFRCENFKSLSNALDLEDAKTFHIDLKGYTVEELAEIIPHGAYFYKGNTNMKKKSNTCVRSGFATFIKLISLASVCFFSYRIAYLHVKKRAQIRVYH